MRCIYFETVLNDFVSKLVKGLWSRINSCHSILFSNLKQKKKKHRIIISRITNSNIGPMNIETPNILDMLDL